jgi:excisionase family DNA binding protein
MGKIKTMPQTLTPVATRPMLTPAEAARVANVSRKTIYREIDRGVLPAYHVGRQLRVDPADFARYLDRSAA